MSKELIINVDGKERKCFLQTGFYSHTRYKSLEFHRHSYPEIHIFVNCKAKFITEERTFSLNDGDVVMVPREVIHAYKMGEDENSLHCTFQLDVPCDKVIIKSLPRDFTLEFLGRAAAIDKENMTADHSSVVPYLSFIGTSLTQNRKSLPNQVSDYAFLIREYMEHNYPKNITLEELSRQLCVSKKQTERLMLKHTGNTFLEELTLIRMKAADSLLKVDCSMSLTKIAPRVGYQSYSGFYKAYKKYKSSKGI